MVRRMRMSDVVSSVYHLYVTHPCQSPCPVSAEKWIKNLWSTGNPSTPRSGCAYHGEKRDNRYGPQARKVSGSASGDAVRKNDPGFFRHTRKRKRKCLRNVLIHDTRFKTETQNPKKNEAREPGTSIERRTGLEAQQVIMVMLHFYATITGDCYTACVPAMGF